MLLKVDVPNLVLDLHWTPVLKWCMTGCESKNDHQKDMCSKFVNQSKCRSGNNWRDLYDHLVTQRIFTLTMN